MTKEYKHMTKSYGYENKELSEAIIFLCNQLHDVTTTFALKECDKKNIPSINIMDSIFNGIGRFVTLELIKMYHYMDESKISKEEFFDAFFSMVKELYLSKINEAAYNGYN